MNAEGGQDVRPRHRYRPTVEAFLPGCAGEELELRCSLLLLRDNATVIKGSIAGEAWPLLDHVERLASEYALSSMKLDSLRQLRRAVVMITAQANTLDALFAPRPVE